MKIQYRKIDEKNQAVIVDGVEIGSVWKGQNSCWQGYDLNDKQITHYEPSRKKAAESLIKEIEKQKKQSIKPSKRAMMLEKAYWKCNKIGENVIAGRILETYKTFDDSTDEEIEAMENYIHQRMGLGRNLVSKEQYELLEKGGYFE
jgi:7-cyano-7-deazaguanine synthase in queuosine biosynthesis